MSEFTKLIPTDAGRELMADVFAGNGKISFTRMVVSSRVYTEEEIAPLTDISGVEQEADSVRVTKKGETAVRAAAEFNNRNLEDGYYIRAVGLYTQTAAGSEILYAAALETSGNAYMPPYNDNTVSSICIDLYITVENMEHVTLKVDPAGMATIGDIQELRESLDQFKSVRKDAVLYASEWTGTDSPYSYSLPLEDATAGNNIEILPPPDLTIEQYEQMEAAKITGGTQEDGSITLLAYGDRPDIDLPVVILVRGD